MGTPSIGQGKLIVAVATPEVFQIEEAVDGYNDV